MTTGLEKGERHRASDDQDVDGSGQSPDRLQLVRDLRAAEDRDEGSLGRFDGFTQVLQLLLQESTRDPGSVPHRFGDRHHRRVGAMGGSEGVVAVAVHAGGEGPSEPAVPLLLARVEAKILQQEHAAGFEGGDRRPGRLVGAVMAREDDVASQVLSKSGRDGGE